MDYRIDSFTKKFASAQRDLKSPGPQNIVSIKFRDNCVAHSDYQHFVHDYLTSQCGLEAEPLNGDYQGSAWVVSDEHNNRIILVEHETGLEILYIAGSVASIIGLIPLIASGWRFARNGFPFRHHPPHDRWQLELRRLNARGKLIEQQIESLETHLLSESVEEFNALKARIDRLERDMRKLRPRKRKKT